MQTITKKHHIIFFITVWVFCSQNAMYINFRVFNILRWILPILLLLSVAPTEHFKKLNLPGIVIAAIIAATPSLFVTNYLLISLSKLISFLIITYCLYGYFLNISIYESLCGSFRTICKILIIFEILNLVFIVNGIGYTEDRAVGITTNSNTLGVYSVITYWCAIFLTRTANKKVEKFFLYFLLFATVVLSLLSGSRTAFIVILINIALSVWMYMDNPTYKLILSLILIIFGYWILYGNLGMEITALNRIKAMGTSRDDIWELGISVWKQDKWFGKGYMTSSFYNPIISGLAFHNSYLSYLIEVGLVGISTLVVGIIPTFFKCTLSISKMNNSEDKYIFLSVYLIVVDLMITAWGESFLFSVGSTEGFLFWTLLMFLCVLLMKCKQ